MVDPPATPNPHHVTGRPYDDGIKNSFGLLEASGTIERSRESTRFWTDYGRQIALAAGLGLNAFRFGVDWARVQPSTSLDKTDPPAWDGDAVANYARIAASVIRHRMEPIVTLHHFTHPAWAGIDMWLDDEGPDRLVEFQVRVVEELNDQLGDLGPLPHFIVYNEVNLVPFMYHWVGLFPTAQQGVGAVATAFDNMLSRYVQVYDGINDLYERRGWLAPQIGFGVASQAAYKIDKGLYDLVHVRQLGIERDDVASFFATWRDRWNARIRPLAASKLTAPQLATFDSVAEQVAAGLDLSMMTKTLDAIYSSSRRRKLDYLSCNIYDPFGLARSTGQPEPPRMWEFSADVEIYGTYTRAYHDGNTDLPVHMGENGLLLWQPRGGQARPRPDGWNRERYLTTYLMEMVRCMKEGVPIRGYLFWSIVDDFEWENGYTPHVGLYGYDYDTHEISDTDALGDPAGPIYANLVAALRSGDTARIQHTFTYSYASTQPGPLPS